MVEGQRLISASDYMFMMYMEGPDYDEQDVEKGLLRSEFLLKVSILISKHPHCIGFIVFRLLCIRSFVSSSPDDCQHLAKRLVQAPLAVVPLR